MGELITNGDFEDGLTGWSVGNGVASIEAPGAQTWVSPHSGTKMLRQGLNANVTSSPFPVSDTQNLVISIANNSYSTDRQVSVSLITDTDTVQVGTFSSGGQKWATDWVEIQVPAGATTARLRLSVTTLDMRIDDVSVTPILRGGAVA